MDTQLQLTVAKLELKQLELIDKLSEKHNDYVIRIVQSSITDKFVAVNGDWELITGFKECDFVSRGWEDLIVNKDKDNVFKKIELIKKTKDFQTFNTTIEISNNKLMVVNWKGKYFSEINGLVFIGRVKRG